MDIKLDIKSSRLKEGERERFSSNALLFDLKECVKCETNAPLLSRSCVYVGSIHLLDFSANQQQHLSFTVGETTKTFVAQHPFERFF